MAKEYKVCTVYYCLEGKKYFNVDGRVATEEEKGLLQQLKDETGWPMFMYPDRIEDAYGNVVHVRA